MQKINTPDGLFHDGNSASGVLGTLVSAAWLNAMQGELVSVIEGAGIKLDAAKTDQLNLAIQSLIQQALANGLKVALQAKMGAVTPLNKTSAGYAFWGDNDSGLFCPVDGTLQLATNGIPFMIQEHDGPLRFTKGLRLPKGVGQMDSQNHAGLSFGNDGDTGLFAEGGSPESGSVLEMRVDNVQLLQAFPAGVHLSRSPTCDPPPQFDISTKLATTGYAWACNGNYSGHAFFGADATLVGAHSGRLVGFTGSSSFTITLPPTSALADGVVYHFVNFTHQQQLIALSGADFMVPPGGGSSITSLALQAGETVDICCVGSNWDIVGGSASLRFSAGVSASFAANGYARLPNGLILQWGGQSSSGTSSSNLKVTFPMAFPNACLQPFCTVSGITAGGYAITSGQSKTGASFTVFNAGGSPAAAYGTQWLAIGW
ncbi:gp53-like domain-containing protein [Aquitalea aquatica]|uniref:Putative tail fiber protein gp53-like C-terminal domain-containing protein n=1 Tax=Aquitalea aquatica TaxID=3044273 RepID=A0A838Y2S7_9NEIS|nr:hypothetical protein [Aquitalea magnusonii]MBA4709583.1 hypothetical protein [Aquitalea magnusonii]